MERIVMERIIFLPIVAVIALLLWQLRNLIRSSFLDAIGVACNSPSSLAIIKETVCRLG